MSCTAFIWCHLFFPYVFRFVEVCRLSYCASLICQRGRSVSLRVLIFFSHFCRRVFYLITLSSFHKTLPCYQDNVCRCVNGSRSRSYVHSMYKSFTDLLLSWSINWLPWSALAHPLCRLCDASNTITFKCVDYFYKYPCNFSIFAWHLFLWYSKTLPLLALSEW